MERGGQRTRRYEVALQGIAMRGPNRLRLATACEGRGAGEEGCSSDPHEQERQRDQQTATNKARTRHHTFCAASVLPVRCWLGSARTVESTSSFESIASSCVAG